MKKVLIAAMLASTLTAGVLRVTFNGSTDIQETEVIANAFKNKAVEYISKAEELEKLVQDQNTDINALVTKINELKELRTSLTTKIKALNVEIEGAEGEKQTLTTEVNRLKGELEKANAEIEKANTEIQKANEEVNNHKTAMTALLNSSIFNNIDVPKRIDVSGALDNIDVEYNLQNSSPNEAGAKQYYNSIKELVDAIDFTEEQKAAISLVKITISDNISDNSEFTAQIAIHCTDRASIYKSIENKIDSFNAEYETSKRASASIV